MSTFPVVIHLAPRSLRRRDGVPVTILRQSEAGFARRVLGVFALSEDELRFAREVLAERPCYWVFRSNQRAFCGDFVLVDMSSPRPERRRVFVVDLKRGATVREGGGGAGVQLTRARAAVDAIATRFRAVPRGAAFRLVTGDRARILDWLRA